MTHANLYYIGSPYTSVLDKVRGLAGRAVRSYALYIALGVVVGLVVAPVAWTVSDQPEGTVAVIPVEGGLDGQSAAATVGMLQKARSDPDVDAIVLVANSPGGAASASETLYLEVAATAERMPVVASIDATAASGAYYTVVPSDYIYAKPSSIVGSIGVFAIAPQSLEPNDIVVTSGPNKLSGDTERGFKYLVESLRRAFVSAVFEQRSDNLTLTREQVSHAGIYGGAQAVRYGLADEIGGKRSAIRKAAQLAGLDSYKVKIMRPGRTTVFVSRANYLASNATDKRLVSPVYFVGTDPPSSPNILMIAPQFLPADEVTFAANATGGADADPAANTTEVPDGAN